MDLIENLADAVYPKRTVDALDAWDLVAIENPGRVGRLVGQAGTAQAIRPLAEISRPQR